MHAMIMHAMIMHAMIIHAMIMQCNDYAAMHWLVTPRQTDVTVSRAPGVVY